MENVYDIIKESVLALLLESSIHGIPNIIRAKRLLFKLIWLLILSLFVSTCFYFVLKSIFEYLNFETITNYETVYEQSSEFPTISICSDFNKKFKFNILSCHFNYKRIRYLNNFETYNDSAYGKCYRFNSGKNLTGYPINILNSTISGFFYGFDLQLYVEPIYDYERLIIHIHNHAKTPLSLFNKEVYLTSGSLNYFSVNRILEQKLTQPYNLCYKDFSKFPKNDTIINYIQNKNIAYTQKECIRLCQNLIFRESRNDSKCNCFLQGLDDSIFIRCNLNEKNSSIKDCTSEYLLNFELRKCNEYCPLECDSFTYEIQHYTEVITHTGNITAETPMLNFRQFKTYSNLSRSFFDINVYYEDLKYTLISQKPKMEIFDLFSKVGGLFGLFLGMGLMSFIELFEIILETFLILLKFKK